MNLFKPITFKWWEAGIFKIGMAAFGIAVGAYWPGFFAPLLIPILVVAVICLAYSSYVWLRQ